ncbi:MAG TPA: methyltransferase domain-containing protein [Syntrophales bacterium]|jgi:SAM-dependent methyltransferase|nr:methyltransferase domain-containing protein [Syntrophales bacterium]HOU77820.1 methyltransferase domain-containing protein [Syntrophales bacterium]HPC32609.1 methyltransferase domain-containing protein [Syntrophales bacterium]HQG34194.1 methyltransferase domain-containing protein [Syntrophales bacterium]HQI35539.1 methyltransferase domain-containing protein [Syntrophales bacterium]
MLKALRNRNRRRSDLDRAAGDYWAMSDVNERIRDQSHWFGAGRWGRERWLAYGDFFCELALRRLREAGGGGGPEELARQTALEWGCGGGAIVRPLCACFGLVYGLDISAATLRECGKRVREFYGPGRGTAAGDAAPSRPAGKFIAVPIPAENPAAVFTSIPPASVDFILSIGVFKHFPSQAYTLRVLGVMKKLLKPGGYLFVQIRDFDGSEKYRPKDRDYAQNVITMTSFTGEEFAAQLAAVGLTVRHRQRDGDGEEENHAYYLLENGGAPPSAPDIAAEGMTGDKERF